MIADITGHEMSFGPLRLRAQRIVGKKFTCPEDAVKHMLAMQAQDYAGALWSVGLRTVDSGLTDVEQAIRDRKIVRTWPMRGTLHFLHADDVRWMVDLLAPRATAAAKGRRINQLGLTDTVVDEAERVLRAELKGGKSIVRSEVAPLLGMHVKGLAIDNQHTQHLMRNFGERGIICFGPYEGKQPTFVLLDEWVLETGGKSRAEALEELARRYFTSHGPATLKDFAGWGMLTIRDAKAGLELAKPDLDVVEVDGTLYYFAPGLQAAGESSTLLLPGFDEYLLGYKNRDAVLPRQYADKIVPGGNGMFLPTIVQGAQVVGTWKRRINKSGVVFTYEYFPGVKVQNTATKDAEESYRTFVLERQ